jgi:hypothetical protein
MSYFEPDWRQELYAVIHATVKVFVWAAQLLGGVAIGFILAHVMHYLWTGSV